MCTCNSLAWQGIYYAYQEGNMWDCEFFHPVCSREQNFSGQMLTPGTVKSLLQTAKIIEWECGCTVSLPFTIWFILEYGLYITITRINEKICKLAEIYVFLCFSAQRNSHLGISMSHISSTNQSKQQFTPWHVLLRKLDFIITALITLGSFFQVWFHATHHNPHTPPSPFSMDTKQTFLEVYGEHPY